MAIPRGEAGPTADGVILCHQVRTISALRVRATDVLAGGGIRYLTDGLTRGRVRQALARYLAHDIPPARDGADASD